MRIEVTLAEQSLTVFSPTIKLMPGQGYPISQTEVKFAKFYITQIDDYYNSIGDEESQSNRDDSDYWSEYFTLN